MAEQALTIQNATHNHTTGAILIAVGAATIVFMDGDVKWKDEDVVFFPPDPGLITVQSPVHTLTSGVPALEVVEVPGLEILTVQSPIHALSNQPVGIVSYSPLLVVQNAVHQQPVFSPSLTTGGGLHDNTEHIIYNATNYLRCRHLHGRLDGVYTSPIFDIGSADRYLVYVVGQDTGEEDIVVVGAGTTWDAQVPVPATWNSINVATSSWTNIFALDKGPAVTMRVYYGAASPPTNYIDKMEILSAIVTDTRYLQVRITITDPGPEVYAYVEEFYLRFCQPVA